VRFLADAFAVLLFLRQAVILERLRVGAGPRPAVQFARRLGERRRRRSAVARKALQRAIAILDRRWPGGPNCYRRVLFEIGMDRGAAAELVQLGFQGSGEAGSGHAWLGEALASKDGRSYEAIVSI
jgi:hypothetical protein